MNSNKAVLLFLAVSFVTTGAAHGALISVLDWGGTITDTTSGGTTLDTGAFTSAAKPAGVQLNNISDGVFDPVGVSSPDDLAGYSYLTTATAPSAGAGPTNPVPVIVFDLGADTVISGYRIWNYREGNTINTLDDFTLSFATAAEGSGGFGTSIIDINASAGTGNDTGYLGITAVTARYAEFSLLSRNGGRRVGVEEIQFDLSPVPEPASCLLVCLGLIGLLGSGRRRKR
jgi:hypothetical protein